jgi:hypothetical protein
VTTGRPDRCTPILVAGIRLSPVIIMIGGACLSLNAVELSFHPNLTWIIFVAQ